MQHGGDEPAPGRNLAARGIAPGVHAALLVDQAGWHLSGRLVMLAQHHLDPVAGEMSGAQSAGKRLAVPARQLALQTESSNPTTTSPPTIATRGLGTTSSISTLADRIVHRPSQLGGLHVVLTSNESWYKGRVCRGYGWNERPRRLADEPHCLLRLHGEADSAQGRVLTGAEYTSCYGNGGKYREVLKQLIANTSLLVDFH